MTLPGGFNVTKGQGVWAIVAMIGLAAAILVAIVLTAGVTSVSTPWIASVFGLIASSVPAIISMLNSADVKAKLDSGHVKSEVTKALVSSHVSTTDSPAATAALMALTKLLETNTAATQENTAVLKEHEIGGDENNGR